MEPLHLKYRPKTLSQVVGQAPIAATLANAIKHKNVAPAYLFSGPRGTGKTSTARILAMSLNCLKAKEPTTTPCGRCSSCAPIINGTSLDIVEVDAASHNGVDAARELIESVALAPVVGRYRVIILDEAQMLTKEAQNALLKTLEEPPSRSIFVLCTTELHKILPTIVSRCQHFGFRSVPLSEVAGYLQSVAEQEDIGIEREALRAIARMAEGGLRDALQLLYQVAQIEIESGASVGPEQVAELAGHLTEADLLPVLKALAAGDVLNLLLASRTLVEEGRKPELLLSGLTQVVKDLLLLKYLPDSALTTGPVTPRKLKALLQQWSTQTINAALQQLLDSERTMKTSQPAVWLEVCILNLVPSLATSLDTPAASKPVAAALDPAAVWQQVVDRSGKAEKLLRHGALAVLEPPVAVLEVPEQYLNNFTRHQKTLQKWLSETVGEGVQLQLTICSSNGYKTQRKEANKRT